MFRSHCIKLRIERNEHTFCYLVTFSLELGLLLCIFQACSGSTIIRFSVLYIDMC
jgi:hypothetical protein